MKKFLVVAGLAVALVFSVIYAVNAATLDVAPDAVVKGGNSEFILLITIPDNPGETDVTITVPKEFGKPSLDYKKQGWFSYTGKNMKVFKIRVSGQKIIMSVKTTSAGSSLTIKYGSKIKKSNGVKIGNGTEGIFSVEVGGVKTDATVKIQ